MLSSRSGAVCKGLGSVAKQCVTGVAKQGTESLLFLPAPLAFRRGTVPAYLPPSSPSLNLQASTNEMLSFLGVTLVMVSPHSTGDLDRLWPPQFLCLHLLCKMNPCLGQ